MSTNPVRVPKTQRLYTKLNYLHDCVFLQPIQYAALKITILRIGLKGLLPKELNKQVTTHLLTLKALWFRVMHLKSPPNAAISKNEK
jgi:hypothetical protein